MDTPKPVIPVNNFAPQALGLKGLINSQSFYSTTGSVPAANNTLPTSDPGDVGGPAAYFKHLETDESASTTGRRSPLAAARRYDDEKLGYDVTRESNENLYAEHQGAMASIGAGLARLALTTVTKLGTGVGYLGAAAGYGIAAPFSDSQQKANDWITSTADNAFSNFFNGLEDEIKQDLLPIYQETVDTKAGFFRRAATDLNFWTDDLVDGAAFMLSSMIPGMALSKIGLGARAVAGLASKVNKAEDAAEILAGLTQKGIKGYDALNQVGRVNKLISNAKLARNIDVGLTTMISTPTEAMVEANDVRKQVIGSLTGRINEKTGTYYTPDEIRQASAQAAMDTFNGNLAALSMSNLWEANLLFKRLPTSAAASGAVSFGEGLMGAASVAKLNKIKAFGKNAAKGFFAEGVWEENAQLAIQRLNEGTYGRDSEGAAFKKGFWNNYLNQLGGALTGKDQEAAMSIGMGAILGAGVGGILSTKEDIRENKVLAGKAAGYNSIVDTFKGMKGMYETEEVVKKDDTGKEVKTTQLKMVDGQPVLNKERFASYINGNKQLADLMAVLDKSVETKNESMTALVQNELMSQFALAHFELGETDKLKEKLKSIANISEEDLPLLGFDPSNKEEAKVKMPAILSKVEELEDLYNSIQENIVPTGNQAFDQARTRKLYELGSRQQLLISEHNKAQAYADSLDKAPFAGKEANRLIAAERAAKQRVDGLRNLINNNDIDRDAEVQVDLLSEAEDTLATATKEKNDYLEKNAEELKDLKKKDEFYDGEQSNSILDAKRNGALLKAAGLQYALVDTVNKFDRIADAKVGKKYFESYITQEDYNKAPIDPQIDNYSKEDQTFLNERMTALAAAAKYDELTKDYPSLLKPAFPINQKLLILRKLAPTNPLAQELLDAFTNDVAEFQAKVDELTKAAERKEAEVKKVQENEAKNDEIQQKLDTFNDTQGDTATGSFEEDLSAFNKLQEQQEEDVAKKPINRIASTSMREGNANKDGEGNFIERFQHLMINLSTHPERAAYQLFTVNAKSEKALGLNGIIDIVYQGNTVDRTIPGTEPIVTLYGKNVNGKFYPVDKKGEIIGPSLQELNENNTLDLGKAVFAPFTTTALEGSIDGKKFNRYSRYSSDEEANDWAAAWKEKRDFLLSLENDGRFFDFTISRGHSQLDTVKENGKTIYNKNPVAGTIVSQAEIDANADILQVSTTGKVVHEDSNINVPVGRPYLKVGSIFELLSNRNFTEAEAENIFELLKALGEGISERGEFNPDIISYLQSVLVFGRPIKADGSAKPMASNQVYFDKGFFIFGKNNVKIPFSAEGMEQNRDTVIDLIKGMYNNVNNARTKTGRNTEPFVEVSVKEDGTLATHTWKSYRHFLFSPVDKNGNKITPLVSTIVRPIKADVHNDRNRQGLYATAIGMIDPNALPKRESPEPVKKEEPKQPAAPAAQADPSREIVIPPLDPAQPEEGDIVQVEAFGATITFKIEGGKYKFVSAFSIAKQKMLNLPANIIQKLEDGQNGIETPAEQPAVPEAPAPTLANVVSGIMGNQGLSIMDADILRKGTSVINGIDKATPEQIAKIKADFEELKKLHPEMNLELIQTNDTITVSIQDQLGAAVTPVTEVRNDPHPNTQTENSNEVASSEVEDSELDKAIAAAQARKNGKSFGEQEFYRVVTEGTYEVGDMAKEAAFISEKLGIPVERFTELLRTTQGGFAFGKFVNGAIELSDKAEIGTGFHEAFEAVWAMFLNRNEKVRALKEFRGRSGSFFDRTSNQNIAYSAATDFQVKERLAEEFRELMLADKAGKTKKSFIAQMFQQLLDFVRNLLRLNANDLASIFRRINAGYYKKQGPITSAEGTEEYRIAGMNEADSYHTIRAVTLRVFSEFFKEGRDLTDFDQIGGNYNDLFAKVKEGLQEHFENYAAWMSEQTDEKGSPLYTRQQIKDMYKSWSNIQADWSRVIKEVKDNLQTFKIVVIDDEYNPESKEDPDRDTGKEDSYLIDHFKFDGKATAPASVKLAFAMLVQAQRESTENARGLKDTYPKIKIDRHESTGLEKPVKMSDVFNEVTRETASANTLQEKIERIKQLAFTNPSLVRFVKRLRLEESMDNFGDPQWNILLKINATMSRNAPVPLIQYIEEDGTSYTGSANLEETRRVVAQGWIDSMKVATKNEKKQNVVITYNDKKNTYVVDKEFLTKAVITEISDKVNFLNQLGINVESEEIQNLSTEDRARFSNAVNQIHNTLMTNQVIIGNTAKSMEIEAPMYELSEVIAKSQHKGFESTYYNIEGKKVQEYVLNNEFSTVVNDINNAKDLSDLYNRLPHLRQKFSNASYYLKEKLFNNGKRGKIQLQLKYVQGTIDQRKNNPNIPTDTLNYADRVNQEINQNLQGNFYMLVPGDSKTEWMIGLDPAMSLRELADIKAGRTEMITRIKRYYDLEQELFKDDQGKRTFHFLSEGYKKSGAEIRETIEATIDQWAKETFDDLLRYNVLQSTGDGAYTWRALDSKYAFNNGVNRNHIKPEDVMKLITLRTFNYMVANTEITKLFFGDAASYTDLKRYKSFASPRTVAMHNNPEFDAFANRTKNTVYYTPTGGQDKTPQRIDITNPLLGYHHFKDYMKTVTMKSVIVANSLYPKIDSTDAQAWATLPAYREYMLKIGSWDNQYEALYQRTLAEDRLNMYKDKVINDDTYPSNLRAHDRMLVDQEAPSGVYFQPSKPIVSGFDAVRNMPLLDKFSIVPLTYTATRGYAIEKHYLRMLKEGVSYTIVETGRKIGKQAKEPFYNPDGTMNTNPFDPKAVVHVPFKYFGNQVENTGKKFKQTRGSQMTKLVLLNQMAAGVPVDFQPEVQDHAARQQAWALAPQEVKDQSAVYRRIRHNIDILHKMTDLGYQTLLKKLGIEEITEIDEVTQEVKTRYNVYDKRKVVKLLQDELLRREVTNNLREAIQFDEKTQDFTVPLEAMNNYSQIRTILFSYIDKYIASPKLNGGPKVQVSGAMWDINGKRVIRREDDGEPVYVSSGLNFYEYKEGDVSIKRMQVLLPNVFAKQLKKQFKGLSDEQILEYLKEHPQSSSILSGIGFRIPTQEMNSMEIFEIVGFLPEYMGDTIVVPEAITKKAGSDFDIDKLNTYIKNLTYNPSTRDMELVEFKGDEQATRQYYSDLFDAQYKDKLDSAKEFMDAVQASQGEIEGLDELVDKYQKQLDEIFDDVESIEDQELAVRDLQEDLQSKIARFGRLKDEYIDKMYQQALENEYFNSLEDILLQPANFARLIAPNNVEGLTGVRNRLLKMAPAEFDAAATKSTVNPKYMSTMRHYYMLGKKGVGIAAVQQTLHAISQLSNIYLDSNRLSRVPSKDRMFFGDGQINLPHNTIKTRGGRDLPSLSGIKDRADKFITDKISEYINGYVDITADPFIIQVGADKTLASTYMMLEKLGVPTNIVVLFMNQPIIREYMKNLAADNQTWILDEDRITALRKTLLPPKGQPIALQTDLAKLDKELEGMITQYYVDRKSDETFKAKQAFVLDEFIKYVAIAGDLFKLTQGTNYDTASFIDSNAMFFKNIQMDKAENETMISSASVLMSNTFTGKSKVVLNKGSEATSALFIIEQPEARAGFEPIKLELAQRLSQEDFVKAARKVEQSFINAMVYIREKMAGTAQTLMLTKETSLVKELEAKKEQWKDIDLGQNIVLQKLMAFVDTTSRKPTYNIRLAEKAFDVFTLNVETEAMKELRDNPLSRSLYEKLLQVAFLQGGISKSKTSFLEILPVEDFKNFIIPVLNSLTDSEVISTFVETNGFYRNNWNDNSIVPRVKMRKGIEGSKVHNYIRLKTPGTQEQKDAAISSYRMLRLSSNRRDAQARFIRVVIKNPDLSEDVIRQMNREGDRSYLKTYLMQRVEDSEGNPKLYESIKKPGQFDVLYYPTYAWGHSFKAIEYHEGVRPSMHDNGTYNPPIVLSNEMVDMLYRGTFKQEPIAKKLEQAQATVPVISDAENTAAKAAEDEYSASGTILTREQLINESLIKSRLLSAPFLYFREPEGTEEDSQEVKITPANIDFVMQEIRAGRITEVEDDKYGYDVEDLYRVPVELSTAEEATEMSYADIQGLLRIPATTPEDEAILRKAADDLLKAAGLFEQNKNQLSLFENKQTQESIDKCLGK